MNVYYVTATHHSLPEGPSGTDEKARIDIGKFFTRKDAEDHVGKRHGTWRDLRVEEREESQEQQHVAHGGKVGVEPAQHAEAK
jgi:hypothetical protein